LLLGSSFSAARRKETGWDKEGEKGQLLLNSDLNKQKSTSGRSNVPKGRQQTGKAYKVERTLRQQE
jgi:hypothetical protein